MKELDLTDVELPLEEIRAYLVRRYSSRFSLHPRLFEEVVASVFQDLAYYPLVTAYSRDGGIDVILERNEESIGVQVKRYRSTISVEQIRSLAGSLVLAGKTKGIFVTTSGFSKDAKTATELFQERGLRIELCDADAFLEALSLAQVRSFDPIQFEHAYRTPMEVFAMGGYI